MATQPQDAPRALPLGVARQSPITSELLINEKTLPTQMASATAPSCQTPCNERLKPFDSHSYSIGRLIPLGSTSRSQSRGVVYHHGTHVAYGDVPMPLNFQEGSTSRDQAPKRPFEIVLITPLGLSR